MVFYFFICTHPSCDFTGTTYDKQIQRRLESQRRRLAGVMRKLNKGGGRQRSIVPASSYLWDTRDHADFIAHESLFYRQLAELLGAIDEFFEFYDAQHPQRVYQAAEVANVNVKLAIACRDLIRTNRLGRSYHVVRVSSLDPVDNEWLVRGETERVNSGPDPDFERVLELDSFRLEVLKVEVFATNKRKGRLRESNLVGCAVTTVGDLCAHSTHSLALCHEFLPKRHYELRKKGSRLIVSSSFAHEVAGGDSSRRNSYSCNPSQDTDRTSAGFLQEMQLIKRALGPVLLRCKEYIINEVTYSLDSFTSIDRQAKVLALVWTTLERLDLPLFTRICQDALAAKVPTATNTIAATDDNRNEEVAPLGSSSNTKTAINNTGTGVEDQAFYQESERQWWWSMSLKSVVLELISRNHHHRFHGLPACSKQSELFATFSPFFSSCLSVSSFPANSKNSQIPAASVSSVFDCEAERGQAGGSGSWGDAKDRKSEQGSAHCLPVLVYAIACMVVFLREARHCMCI